VLADLHEVHQGTVCTKQRARLTVYWPGINNDIDNIIAACQLCQDHLPSNPKEPIVSKPRPPCPFQKVAVDFYAYGGKQFLIIVDCFTDWPDIIPTGANTTTKHVVSTLQSALCRTAIPDILWSDGGPQFTSRMFSTLGLCSSYIFTKIPPEQWQRSAQDTDQQAAHMLRQSETFYNAGHLQT